MIIYDFYVAFRPFFVYGLNDVLESSLRLTSFWAFNFTKHVAY